MNMIVAVDENWAIGNKNDLLIRIPADMKMFRQETTGKVVVLGRKTLETFPNGLPLPKRTNIILSKNADYQIKDAIVVNSVDALLETLKAYDTKDVYIIGGGELYKQTIGLAKRIHLTLVDDVPAEADAFFPDLNPEEWSETAREEHAPDEKHAQAYAFIDYIRK